MEIIRTIEDLTKKIDLYKENNMLVGIVPTMGALHEGHLSLVEKARRENDKLIVSVFVNPTQFNNPSDLATYPRKEKEDFELLQNAGVDIVFAPSVEEIYPAGIDKAKEEKVFELGSVADVMEGKFRPGHFQGVAQIVNKLFLLVKPDRAYFGQKDFQQIAVIRQMVKNENLPVEIISCPIKRADDGLALSSRNLLLSPEQRLKANNLFKVLNASLEYSKNHSVDDTIDWVVGQLNSVNELQVEYFEIVDGDSLLPVKDWNEKNFIVGCLTCYCGNVRLIDNIVYKN